MTRARTNRLVVSMIAAASIGVLAACGAEGDEVSSTALSSVDAAADEGGRRIDLGGEGAPAEVSAPGSADRRAALQSLRDGADRDALRRALSESVLDDGTESGVRERHLEELRSLNERLVFVGPRTAVPHRVVEVVPGDNLTRIARRVKKEHGNNVTPALVAMLNGLRSDTVFAGQKLAVPTENLEVVVRKSDYALYLVLGGAVVRDYRVGLGRDGSTPTGEFRVSGKTKNPSWRTPEGRVVPFGDPDHIIGNRWMGFDDEAGRTGYGIHGTIDETSIGKSESDGCIRLAKADVEELFDLVPEDCRVVVRP